MKRNTAESKTTPKVSRLVRGQDRFTGRPVRLPSEMAGRADARELREFMRAFSSIDDQSVRQRILDEVLDASQEIA